MIENDVQQKKDIHGGVRHFLSGFIITLLLLIPVYILVISKNKQLQSERAAAEKEVSLEKRVSLTAADYTLCLLGEQDGELAFTAVLRFCPADIAVCGEVLPKNTLLLYKKRPKTAEQLYKELGSQAVYAAVCETLCIKADGFIAADAAAIFDGVEPSLADLQLLSSLVPQRLIPAVQSAIGLKLSQKIKAQDIESSFIAASPKSSIDAAGISALARAAASLCGDGQLLLQFAGACGESDGEGRYILLPESADVAAAMFGGA